MANHFALEPELEHLVFDTIEDADAACSPEDLSRRFEKACKRLGFSHFGTFSVLDAKGQTIGAYEAGHSDPIWRDHYIAQDHFHDDAIVRLIPSSLDAVVWRDLSASRTLTKAAQRIFDEAAEFGHKDGFVLPQHYLNGAIAATILGAPHAIPSNKRFRAAANILSSYFAAGVRRLVAPQASPARVHLSPRQRECLQWVRAGKSDYDIGEILGLSEHTVRGHVEEARKRFGVKTRTQAVIEALNQRLIHL